MKKPFSSVIVIFLGLAVLPRVEASCPNLRGTFLCRQNSYRQDTHYTFDQGERAGIFHYTIAASPPGGNTLSSFEFSADGVYRDVVDHITGQILNLRAFCARGVLEVDGTFTTSRGQTIRFSESLSLTQQGHLQNVSLDIHGNIVHEICERLGISPATSSSCFQSAHR